MAGMFNIWDAQQQRRADTQDIGKDYASLPEGRVAVSVLGQTGARLGGGMMKAAGFSNPDEERRMAIQEIKARFPNEPKTAQEYRTIGNALIDVAPEQAKLFFDQAKNLTTTPTTASFNLSKLQDSLAYLESVSGETFTDIEKKQWLARTKNTVTVTDSGGQVDSGKTNFNAILDDRGNKKKNDFRFADTEITGATQKKDLAIFDTKVTRMSKDMSKASNAESTLSRLEEGMSKYKNPNGTWKDIPGFSNLEQFTRSAEGDELSAMWENVIGELRKERFGSVLTPSEQKSFDKIKTGNFFFLPDEAVIKFVEDLRAKIDSEKNKVSAGYSDDVVAEYNSRLFKQNAKIESGKLQAQIQKAKDSGYSDAQISEFIKMKQGGK